MWKPDVIVYHHPCDDGFACAWIARKKWPDIRLAPTNYGLPFPEKDIDGEALDIEGKNVLIADFSYKRAELAALGERARSIMVLDHHKTAAAELAEFNRLPFFGPLKAAQMTGIVVHFDMDYSGAALTWRFCFPDEPPPYMVRLIEDRDLWRFEMKQTRAFTLLLRSHPYDLEIWDTIDGRLSIDPQEMMNEAWSIERYYDRQIADIVPTATLKSIGKWKNVPVAHAPYALVSDLAHQLLKAHPEAPFAAVVVDAYGERTWSLRSEDSRQDVSEVAKLFGGGGHRNAAGFRVPV
jgi:uncharacterized protein